MSERSTSELISRLSAWSHDDRLGDGQLLRDAAERLQWFQMELGAVMAERNQLRAMANMANEGAAKAHEQWKAEIHERFVARDWIEFALNRYNDRCYDNDKIVVAPILAAIFGVESAKE